VRFVIKPANSNFAESFGIMVATETDGSDRTSRLPCEVWCITLDNRRASWRKSPTPPNRAGRSDRDRADPRPFLNAGTPAEYRAGFKDRFPDLEVA
jgi:hypothetical protein